jgi:hypothetical protein
MATKLFVVSLCLGFAVVLGPVVSAHAPQAAKKEPTAFGHRIKEPAGQPKEPQPITIKEQLTNADPFDRVRKQSHHRIHFVKLVPGYSYTIRMDTPEFDAYLRLEDAKGKQLAEDDDSGGGLNAQIVFAPSKAGTYRIIATTFGPGMAGFYTLSVRPSRGQAAIRQTILKVAAALTNMDPFDAVRKASYAKVYMVNLEAGKRYQIDMTSSQVDAFVRLEDAKGEQLAQDDDGGGGNNARILFRPLQSGRYRIIATTFADAQTGNFNLVVNEE